MLTVSVASGAVNKSGSSWRTRLSAEADNIGCGAMWSRTWTCLTIQKRRSPGQRSTYDRIGALSEELTTNGNTNWRLFPKNC